MNLFGLLKSQPPKEVIEAVCDFYGVSTREVPALHAQKLKALSNNVWLVNLDESMQAVVAYAPGSRAVVAPWYE